MLDKKRRNTRKRLDLMNESLSSVTESAQSYRDLLDEGIGGSDFESFRSRTQSNVSVVSQRISPPMESFDDFKYPGWGSQTLSMHNSGTAMNELLDRTDQIRLDTEPEFCQLQKPESKVRSINPFNKFFVERS